MLNSLEQFIYEGNNFLKNFLVPQLLGFVSLFICFIVSWGFFASLNKKIWQS